MPATNVPCPRPSPSAFGSRFVIVTCLTTRPPKSVRPAATPLSTIAIAGTFSDDSAFPTKKSDDARRVDPGLVVRVLAGEADPRVGRDREDPRPLGQVDDLCARELGGNAVHAREALPQALRLAGLRLRGVPDLAGDRGALRPTAALHDDVEDLRGMRLRIRHQARGNERPRCLHGACRSAPRLPRPARPKRRRAPEWRNHARACPKARWNETRPWVYPKVRCLADCPSCR